MSNVYAVVDDKSDWEPYYPSSKVISFAEYLDFSVEGEEPTHILNLCRSYKYLSKGYYTSLLAEARNQKVIPSLKAINDLSDKALFMLRSSSLEQVLEKKTSRGPEDDASILVCFGQTQHSHHAELGHKLFEAFPFPLLKVSFDNHEKQKIRSIKPATLRGLSNADEDLFASSLEKFNHRLWRKSKPKKQYRYDLAILTDPDDKLPPSNKTAIKKFIQAAKANDILAECITRKDLARLGEYDALFIRETTATNHYTYTFSRKAESEGIVVIDDPASILRCTNKVFLHQALHASKVATPPTLFLHAGSQIDQRIAEQIGFPIVLKIPDGSFSKGVFLAKDEEELRNLCRDLFQKTELILAQKFMYTAYDWRVGILNKKPLYVCQYYMSKDHWQIYDHTGQKTKYGGSVAMNPHQVPKPVINAAIKATSKIGDGLYGVDIKEKDGEVFVIEVNDNPSIDAGTEDSFLGDELYDRIMAEFYRRLEHRG